jgi:hypothetical protein
MKSFTAATAATLLATISLTSAAPTPQASTLAVGTKISIVQQLNRQDTANQVDGIIDKTSVIGTDNLIVEAAIVGSGATPWCAGFSDEAATKVVKNINFQGDGIFNAIRSASYGDEPVVVASYWCANTRPEVEAFVANAAAANNGQYNTYPAATTTTYAAASSTAAYAAASSTGTAAVDSSKWSSTAATVRVEIETAPDEFRQEELPANVGLQAVAGTLLENGAISVSVVDQTEGDCDFVDANQQAIDFSARKLVQIAQFVCESA